MDTAITSFLRVAVIAISVTILVTVSTLLWSRDVPGSPALWVLLMFFIPPTLALAAATVVHDRKLRVILLWVSAAAMAWPAAMGIFGGYGLLYVIGIIFTLFAAWQENEGK